MAGVDLDPVHRTDDERDASRRRHPSAYIRPERPPLWLILCDELLLEREREDAKIVARIGQLWHDPPN